MELTDGLPPSVADIIEFVGGAAAGYGHLKWNEEAMLKADMMNVWQRWSRVDSSALAAKCRAVGLTQEETAEIIDWLKRRQQGRRLVPEKTYRDFRFRQEPESLPGPTTSTTW
ncbi:hypothetical protein [Plantibacter sp. YIM 135347]|uniref:hypothetical protein n=1 Tax=Plantibacter sp. YIM 135347 TaxID=3423919 RepID=UPI003D353223